MLVIPRGYVPLVSFNCRNADESTGGGGVVAITWVACSTADVVIDAKLKTDEKPKETSNYRVIHNLDREGCQVNLHCVEPFIEDLWTLTLHGLVGPKGGFILEVWDIPHSRVDVHLVKIRGSGGKPGAPDRNILKVEFWDDQIRGARMEWYSEPLTESEVRSQSLGPVRSVRERL